MTRKTTGISPTRGWIRTTSEGGEPPFFVGAGLVPALFVSGKQKGGDKPRP